MVSLKKKYDQFAETERNTYGKKGDLKRNQKNWHK
jgi:hypothetical protein